MDQNSDNGTDKRSWRERLGIGAGKDMPRIADEFAPAAPAAKAAVRPAPMAPRPGVKAAPPRAAAAPAPEKLAEKLKAQRDAQERLAEQRVQAARQRTEIKPEATNGSAAKPKFTFAVEEAEAAAKSLPVPPMPQPKAQPRPQTQLPPAVAKPNVPPRTIMPPPAMNTPPMTPPRQPLGSDRPMMPSPRPSVAPPPVMPTRPQQRYSPPPVPGYNPQAGFGAGTSTVPPYRPMEPNARGYGAGGYAPPPAYVPPVGGYNNQPRLSVPPASGSGGYGADAYDTRARNLRPPARPGTSYRDEYAEADVFADPRATRRATAGDYSQAYRDEQGYDEDLPPSRGPWVPLLMLLLLAILAGAGVWYLYQGGKTPVTGGQSSNSPVIEAPAQPAKVTPDPVQQPQGQPSKKLIYDRIVGDREVLGGDVIQSEEVPAQPGDANNLQGADPAAAPADGVDPAQPTGQEDLVPLPLPPPPGEDGAGDQQGAAPSNKTSNEAMIQPAAGESQAAVPSQDVAQKSDPQGISAVAKSDSAPAALPPPAEAAPVPGETEAAAAATGGETIADAPPAEPESAPVVKKKVVESAAKPKKVAAKKVEKSLGSKPVVLVPPADGNAAAIVDQQVASIETDASTGGLYSGDTIVDPGTPAPATPAPAPVKKKKTLADLFRGENTDDADVTPLDAATDAPIVEAPAPAPAKKTVAAPQPAPQPAPQQQAALGGYVVQLASFPNQADASKEYSRLKSKHGGTLSGLSPIVSQAIVGGSTRYRLAVGVLPSREQASAVCAKLFAAGERDCLVRRQ